MSKQPPDPSAPIRTSGTPRWVMVAGLGLLGALLVLMIVLHLTGVLGPGQH